MLKKINIDPNIEIWMPAYKTVMDGGTPECPHCRTQDMEVTKRENDDGIGFMLITCNSCGKSGYFSRVNFK